MKKKEQVVILSKKLLNSIRQDLNVMTDDKRTKELIIRELRYQLWQELDK